jgi:hypothetical protein
MLDYTTQYSWSITRAANGDKAFTFSAKKCVYYTSVPSFPGLYLWVALPAPVCAPLSQSEAENLGPISAALNEFYNYHPNAPHLPPVYQAQVRAQSDPPAGRAQPKDLSSQQPLAPPDPIMVLLDGLGNTAIQFNLASQSIVGQVTVPSTIGPLGIRPVSTGPQNEIWVANNNSVVVADFAAKKVVATIPFPSSLPSTAPPAGIVFTNDGNTVLEALTFNSPDSAGNTGALLVFDAVGRTLVSTTLLKIRPIVLLMAPDSYTAYLLDSTGKITYYDLLSGTADLSLSTFTPGKAGGYSSSTPVFIHPDGTRLFWNTNAYLSVFDLTTRKVTNYINSGLPGTSTTSIQMSQDGSTIWMTSNAGSVAVYDTRSGNFFQTFTADPQTALYPGVSN